MKPQLLKVSSGPACSFSVRQDNVPFVNNHWHYHQEVELIHIKEGNGTQFIGDSIQSFNSGDVTVVGANLPHFWSFEDRYFSEINDSPNVYVAHFCDNFWGNVFLDIPENLPLKNILDTAKRGIKLMGRTKEYIGLLLEKMLNADGSRKILLLHEALVTIANSDEILILSSGTFESGVEANDNDRINIVYQYSLANYQRKIQLEEIAAVAYISPNSFCRYFKSKTKKTYSNFLIEIRVGMACKLLIENKKSIKQICYESGFYNFASFHKYFKLITNKTPLNYQREFFAKNSTFQVN